MKGILSSTTIQGLLVMFVPWLDQAYQVLSSVPEGMLPKQAALAVSGLGMLIALIGRVKAKQQISLDKLF